MPYVECKFCNATIAVTAKMPLEIINQDGKQVVKTNYLNVYRHMRDNHPEECYEKLTAEYEKYKAEMGEK